VENSNLRFDRDKVRFYTLCCCGVLCLGVAAGCAQGAHRTSIPPSAAKVKATEFVKALVNDKSLAKSMRYAKPAVVTAAKAVLNEARADKLRVTSRGRSGCRSDPFVGLLAAEPCYRFAVRGSPIPDPNNAGFGSVEFGVVQVAVTARQPWLVEGVVFVGGGTEVKLGH
jgi:hypothetical protein